MWPIFHSGWGLELLELSEGCDLSWLMYNVECSSSITPRDFFPPITPPMGNRTENRPFAQLFFIGNSDRKRDWVQSELAQYPCSVIVPTGMVGRTSDVGSADVRQSHRHHPES